MSSMYSMVVTPFISLLATFTSILTVLASSEGVDVKGTVTWNQICSNYEAMGAAHALIDDGSRWFADVERDGRFVLTGVTPGEYTLSLRAKDHVFEQVILEVPSAGQPITKVSPLIPGTALSPQAPRLAYPLKISAVSRHNYFIPREGFSLVAMFSNPMMLMMGVGAILVFATPYLAKQIDPESLKETQSKQIGAEIHNTLHNNNDRREDVQVKSHAGRKQTVGTGQGKGKERRIRKK